MTEFTYTDIRHLMQRDNLSEQEAAKKIGISIDDALEMGLQYAVEAMQASNRVRELMRTDNITMEAAANRLGVKVENLIAENVKPIPGVA